MIFKNIEFHNVEELETIDGMSGFSLQRFPLEVRNSLGHKDHERGRFYSRKSVGCEIRFVTDSNRVRIALSALEQDGTMMIYKGEFFHSFHSLKSGAITTIDLDEPPRFSEIEPAALEGYGFSSKVWRILFGKETCINFHYIESFGHEIRPPKNEEKPKFKWLAYGSSITFGGDTILFNNAYVHQAARRLKVDVLNKGIAGSCFCDKSVVDYISENKEWDFITLELGVNMRGRFTNEEFQDRITYLIKSVIDKHPDKPVIVISIYPNGEVYSLDREDIITKNNTAFTDTAKKVVEKINNKSLYFIEGKEILTDFSGLSTDMLHPSDHGHINMGENLSEKIKMILEL